MHYIENEIFPSAINCLASGAEEICLESSEGVVVALAKAGDDSADFVLSVTKGPVVYVASRGSQPSELKPIKLRVISGNPVENEVGNYKILVFNSNGVFTVDDSDAVNFVEVLIEAGDGGGGSSMPNADRGGGSGGGGAGGYLLGGLRLVKGDSVEVNVGNGGGAGTVNMGEHGENGEDSSFIASLTKLIAIGGGGCSGRVCSNKNGNEGGSGGGAGYNTFGTPYPIGGAGTPIQGNDGGGYEYIISNARGASGGGAGSAGKPNSTSAAMGG